VSRPADEERSVEKPFDFLVVGGGIAGVSVGYELARDGRVCVLEREDQLAFHSTGRSAAIFMETYGNAPVRALTRASRGFYASPPDGFTDEPLTSRRGALFLADEAHLAELEGHFEAVRAIVPSVQWVERDELSRHVPCLAPDRWVAGLFEPGAADLDVHAIHQGYVRGLRARGGVVLTGAEVTGVSGAAGRWTVTGAAGELSAGTLVNAAGAWADVLAGLAGAPPIGLRPLRRTAILVDAPGDVSSWPLVASVNEEFYFKPESRRLLVSPCDETPSEPCNAAPDDYDVAVAVDRLERATTLRPKHVSHRWAGLRSFVADRTPVVGPDPEREGLVWLAAQGGYGIQLAPALARVCRSVCVGEGIPAELAALGLAAGDLSPGRPALRRR
jgi:D-arginine dehydrogenase